MRSLRALAALAATAVLVSACQTGPAVKWVPDGGSLTSAQVDTLAQGADISAVSGVALDTAPDSRNDVLVWLRQKGSDGDRAASLLTIGFPERTQAIPVLVEIADVNGVRSLIAVEAAAGQGGQLTVKRLWLFELTSGKLVRSATFQ
jgi:hypothetical protein